MSKFNAQWHLAHVMPKHSTDQQRAQWHSEHALHCGCRAIAPSIAKLLKANGYEVPETLVARWNWRPIHPDARGPREVAH